MAVGLWRSGHDGAISTCSVSAIRAAVRLAEVTSKSFGTELRVQHESRKQRPGAARLARLPIRTRATRHDTHAMHLVRAERLPRRLAPDQLLRATGDERHPTLVQMQLALDRSRMRQAMRRRRALIPVDPAPAPAREHRPEHLRRVGRVLRLQVARLRSRHPRIRRAVSGSRRFGPASRSRSRYQRGPHHFGVQNDEQRIRRASDEEQHHADRGVIGEDPERAKPAQRQPAPRPGYKVMGTVLKMVPTQLRQRPVHAR